MLEILSTWSGRYRTLRGAGSAKSLQHCCFLVYPGTSHQQGDSGLQGSIRAVDPPFACKASVSVNPVLVDFLLELLIVAIFSITDLI
ncbi:hypothetical protein PoB_003910900 [Plakobranchus ocellatus]|uniref:Uncharacterized protein n=1 Tax=Plakobranchus ocellatus TaxID=259542 RepID=A0AAV4AXV3_9GAST|nr:hypothetical protein PoB_003910900 [Plakobranchus ocellatus]